MPPEPPLPAAPRAIVPAPSPEPPASPRWGVFTKFLVSLVFVVVVGALLVRFQQIIIPLVVALILTYLLKPLVEALHTRTRMSWGAAAAVVYIGLIVGSIAVLTVAGIAVVQQIQDLYTVVLQIANNLPERLDVLLSEPVNLGPLGVIDFSRPFMIGPFGPFAAVDIRTGTWEPIYNQLVAAIQPALSRVGDLVGVLASGTASTLGWGLFVAIISYYLLVDVRTLAVSIERLVPEAYAYDVRRLIGELGPIWNAFLRGQLQLGIVMGLIVGAAMAVMGVRYSLVLGLLAGLFEFIPLIGPFIAGGVAVLVALFQPSNWFGLGPLPYAGLVLLVFLLLQQIENNFLVPRILGGSLNLHPVVILVGAIIAANLAGIIGLLLSAPIMATLRLFGAYVYRKMFDLDPWPEPQTVQRAAPERKWARWVRQKARNLWRNLKLLVTEGRRPGAPPRPPPPAPPGPPRVEYSYTIFWTKQAREWDAARRAAVLSAVTQATARPGFEANDYERRYTVAGLDDQAHAGASLVALEKVLRAMEDGR
jgi:predicted PurR-regulated permease PerM